MSEIWLLFITIVTYFLFCSHYTGCCCKSCILLIFLILYPKNSILFFHVFLITDCFTYYYRTNKKQYLLPFLYHVKRVHKCFEFYKWHHVTACVLLLLLLVVLLLLLLTWFVMFYIVSCHPFSQWLSNPFSWSPSGFRSFCGSQGYSLFIVLLCKCIWLT